MVTSMSLDSDNLLRILLWISKQLQAELELFCRVPRLVMHVTTHIEYSVNDSISPKTPIKTLSSSPDDALYHQFLLARILQHKLTTLETVNGAFYHFRTIWTQKSSLKAPLLKAITTVSLHFRVFWCNWWNILKKMIWRQNRSKEMTRKWMVCYAAFAPNWNKIKGSFW